jgi:hypothetical protein
MPQEAFACFYEAQVLEMREWQIPCFEKISKKKFQLFYGPFVQVLDFLTVICDARKTNNASGIRIVMWGFRLHFSPSKYLTLLL